MTESFELRTSDDLCLEAEWDAPDEPRAVLVFCHPHPQMGGTMNAPLILALKDRLLDDGWAVLRFNFRGIGASEGTSSIGIEEVKDADAAIEEAERRAGDLPVAIAGWSFGAAVALRAAPAHPRLHAIVAIAPAVNEKPGVTAGLPAPGSLELPAPTLLIVGANDDLTPPDICAAWAEASDTEIVEMKGANHFFWAKYPALAENVSGFLDRVVT
jgi:alpha/beta superfamily hydrolase